MIYHKATTTLITAGLILAMASIAHAVPSLRKLDRGQSISIAGLGAPDYTIVHADKATAVEIKAAEDLARILGLSQGRPLSVKAASDYTGGPALFIGDVPQAGWLTLPPSPLEPDGFRIVRAGPNLFFKGRHDEGHAFAVYYFLQYHGGARWYEPGTLGEVIPDRSAWRVNRLNRHVRPSYLSRGLSGMRRGDVSEFNTWRIRNLLRQTLPPNHNIHRVVTPDLFETHPEWFPLINGKRQRPDRISGYNPNPDYTNTALADYAAGVAANYFDQNPDALAFSLAITDVTDFDQSEATRAAVSPLRYYRGRPDFSDLAFAFMNKAAEKLGETHPDKYLSALAYYWTENVPSFPVHPKVIPFITADRPLWHDPVFREEEKDLIRRWTRAGPEIVGVYDYYYGNPFVVPRIFTAAQADFIPFAHREGVRAFYTILGPIWPYDNYKAWLTARLLWDVNQNEAQLRQAFYHDFYGPSAKPIAAFFELAEEAWVNQPPRDDYLWLKYYLDEAQGEFFALPTLERMRQKLDEGIARVTEGSLYHQRLQRLDQIFLLTEAYTRHHHQRRALMAARTSDTPCEETLRGLLTTWPEARQIWLTRLTALNKATSLMERPIPGSRFDLGNPGHGALVTLLSLDPTQTSPEGWEKQWALAQAQPGESLTVNNRFLGHTPTPPRVPTFWEQDRPGDFDFPHGWTIQTRPTETYAHRVLESDGLPRSFRIEGQAFFTIHQSFPVTPGTRFRFEAHLTAKLSPGSRVYLRAGWANAAQKLLPGPLTDRLYSGDYPEEIRLLLLDEAPEDAAFGYIGLFVVDQSPNDYVELIELQARELMPAGANE